MNPYLLELHSVIFVFTFLCLYFPQYLELLSDYQIQLSDFKE
jgi:hypothetical protein